MGQFDPIGPLALDYSKTIADWHPIFSDILQLGIVRIHVEFQTQTPHYLTCCSYFKIFTTRTADMGQFDPFTNKQAYRKLDGLRMPRMCCFLSNRPLGTRI